MAVQSQMLPLGTPAPAFELPDFGVSSGSPADGAPVALADAAGERGTLVAFICNHCPFVHHVAAELAALARDAAPRGVATVAISSNNVETHPDDAPDKMTAEAEARGYAFPYLYDETQAVAAAYTAACTPDFFLFDADLRLVYRGQLDDTRPSSGRPATGADLRDAIDALLEGRPIAEDQKPSIGCGIKWKPGVAPAYATA